MLANLYQEHDDDLLVIIGIHTPGSRQEDIQDVLDLYGMEYTICIDVPTGAAQASLATNYGIRGIPRLVLIDADGNIAGHGRRETILPRAHTMVARLKGRQRGQ